MEDNLKSYYSFFGIAENSSEEDILSIFRSRAEDIYDWKREGLPPDEIVERMDFYKRAIGAICAERNIPFSLIAICLQSNGYYEDPFERERGVPVVLASLVLLCIALFFFMKYRAESSVPSVIFSLVLSCSNFLHCSSGGRTFTEAMKVCYPVLIRFGDNNSGKKFIKDSFLIAILLWLLFLPYMLNPGGLTLRASRQLYDVIFLYSMYSYGELQYYR